MTRSIQLICAVLSLFCAALSAGVPSTCPDHLIAFSLEDQFREVHTQAEFAGKPLILICADRKGSDYSTPWGEAIRRSLSAEQCASVRFASLADLDEFPSIVRGLIRRGFPKDKPSWCLMDWKGQFAETYGLEPGQCSILVFDSTGKLRHKACLKEVEPDALEAITAAVLAALPAIETPAEEPAAEGLSEKAEG